MPNEYLPEEHCVRIQYGKISDRIFVKNSEVSSRKLEGNDAEMTHPINFQAEFQYRPGHNFLQFEVVHLPKRKQVLCKIIPLLDLPFNNFTTRRILAQAKSGQNLQTTEQIQMHMKVSFYVENLMAKQAASGPLQTSLASFTRKKPDIADIFDAQSDFQQITAAFQNIVRQEHGHISQLLSDSIALDIINEMYNHVESGSYGKMSLKQFASLAEHILPRAMQSPDNLEKVFEVFTGTQRAPAQGEATAGGSHAAKIQYRKSKLKQ